MLLSILSPLCLLALVTVGCPQDVAFRRQPESTAPRRLASIRESTLTPAAFTSIIENTLLQVESPAATLGSEDAALDSDTIAHSVSAFGAALVDATQKLEGLVPKKSSSDDDTAQLALARSTAALLYIVILPLKSLISDDSPAVVQQALDTTSLDVAAFLATTEAKMPGLVTTFMDPLIQPLKPIFQALHIPKL